MTIEELKEQLEYLEPQVPVGTEVKVTAIQSTLVQEPSMEVVLDVSGPKDLVVIRVYV